VITKNAVFWNMTPCGSCNNRRFAKSVLQLLVIANVVPSSLILVTLMMEAIHFSDAYGLIGATRLHIPEDGILRYKRIHLREIGLHLRKISQDLDKWVK
jgi:hypothetical protein